MLSIDEILKIYNEGKGARNGIDSGNYIRPRFTLRNLIGETISNVRIVVRENLSNPDRLEVIDFESGRTWIIGLEASQEESRHHCYLVERDGRVRYSNVLFQTDMRERV